MSDTGAIKMNLEVQVIPVSDPDRSKAFYERLGWRLDDDVSPFDGLRIIQFTPQDRELPGVEADVWAMSIQLPEPHLTTNMLDVGDVAGGQRRIVPLLVPWLAEASFTVGSPGPRTPGC